MGIRCESRLSIPAAPAAIHDYLADVGRWPEWAPAIVECRVGGGGVLRPGSRLEQRARAAFRRTRPRTLDVQDVDANRLSFAGVMGPSPMRWGFELNPSGVAQTDVLLWLEAEMRGVMRFIPRSLFVSMVRRVNLRELAEIGNRVTSQPQVGAIS